MLLGHRVVIPVIRVVTQVVRQGCRHVDLPLQHLAPQDCVFRASLHQENTGAGVLGEPVGQNTPGRPGTNDDLRGEERGETDGVRPGQSSYLVVAGLLIAPRPAQVELTAGEIY